MQETFIKAFRSLGGFEERAHFGSWLYRIAVNCFLDWHRKRHVHEELSEDIEPRIQVGMPWRPGHESDSENLLLRMELRQRVEAGLEGLSARERSAFVLRHFEGMSIAEIGRILNLDTSATKHSIFRAVQKMRRILAPMVSQTG